MELQGKAMTTEKQTPKQRYDAAMKAADYIRIQGWTTRENAPKIKKYLVTKCGLDASAGEHLFKKGEIIPKKIKE
jgi:hypothetical protein